MSLTLVEAMPSGSDAGVGASAKSKRPRTEKRAQQNRAAQKRYRDKLKQRTEQLASFAAKHGFDPDAEDAVSDTTGGSSKDAAHDLEHDTQVVQFSDSEPQRGAGPPTGSAWPSLISENPEQLAALLADESVAADVINYPEQLLAQYEYLGPDSKIVKNRKLMLEHCFHVLGLDISHSNSKLTKLASLQGVNLREILLAGVKVMIRQGLVPGKLSDLYPLTPSPKGNNLRFQRFATLDALLSNAMSMGFDIANLYKVHHPSPFYRPDIKSAADIQGSTADYFMGIAPHLRPTSVQIRCWHKPWIDLIPFPIFRMRMILAINRNPPVADPWELKHDVFHDGLIFVGAKSSEEGEPWDMRSWKIAPWFINKWKPVLMGDPIGEY